jgi:anhydro-N-acetylmuramic acid kinase
MKSIVSLTKKKSRVGIGVLSGTSLDGIDVGMVELYGSGERGRVALRAFETYPIPSAIRAKILRNFNPDAARLPELSQLHFLIGALFADAVEKFMTTHRVKKQTVDFIASHGQTFWHNPTPEKIGAYKVSSTFQLGEGSVLANRFCLPVISDFRASEFFFGGEGAPLAPYLDFLLFRHAKLNRALLNIGGISNITALPKACGKSDVIFFDCGPGNVLLDKAAQFYFGKPFDKNGRFAAQGKASEKILSQLLREKYYRVPPPKSTGRELFSDAYFERIVELCKQEQLSGVDVMATLTELTAETIARQAETFIAPKCLIDELIVAGGGAENPMLMAGLTKKFPSARVMKQDNLPLAAIPAKAKEAVLFAVLGNEFLSGQSASMTTPAVLGKLSLPPTI